MTTPTHDPKNPECPQASCTDAGSAICCDDCTCDSTQPETRQCAYGKTDCKNPKCFIGNPLLSTPPSEPKEMRCKHGVMIPDCFKCYPAMSDLKYECTCRHLMVGDCIVDYGCSCAKHSVSNEIAAERDRIFAHVQYLREKGVLGLLEDEELRKVIYAHTTDSGDILDGKRGEAYRRGYQTGDADARFIIKNKIGALRQWLNEKPSERLVENKDIEYFLGL